MNDVESDTPGDSSWSDLARDPTSWVDVFGDRLFRFAMLRLGDQHLAEDFVQQTFLKALESREQFRSESSFLTWLTTIQRNRIVDHFRSTAREPRVVSGELSESDFFRRDGHWIHAVSDWSLNPEKGIETEEFWQALRNCLLTLPDILADVFLLRELSELPSSEVCATLDISMSNFGVRLHRARLALRTCLEQKHYGE